MEGPDLAECGLKSEEDVVQILDECFQRRQYYVEVGDVVVTVNPWRSLEHAEKEVVDFLRLYKSKDKHHPLPPHPCSVAEKAVRNGSDGVIIPLGESGSGKSSNIQIILHYLALRCDAQKLSKDDILAINDVLDLFCNAKTLICNNSTRCVKVHEVFFSKEQSLLGVNVKVHVLEKMRVISQIKGESNFRIFHRLLNGLNSEQLQEYCLDEEHRYIPPLPREAFSDGDSSGSLSLKCLEKIGFKEKEIEDVLHLVSAIILLGDLQFGESSKRDVLAFRNGEVLEEAATLIGVPTATLAGLIITKSKTVRGVKVNISSSRSNAMYECDRLAVICYETLVLWIESRINSRYTGHSRLQSDYSLVLLDVFGWENYSICSFEQLCINMVNEVLQSLYNAVVFNTYQRDLENEDIYLTEACLKFDQPGAVPFLLKPKGLFDVLHSGMDCNDRSLLKKFDSAFKKEARYITNNTQEFSGFTIEHFIGEVSYDIIGCVAQSKNWLNNNALTCLKGSKNKVVYVMTQERIARENTSIERALSSPSSSKKKSVVEKDWLKTNIFLTNPGKEKKKYASIKNSNPAVLTMTLTSLLNRVSSSKAYFIRCINSNLRMQPGVFDHERVLRQVQWSNLYGTVKTRLPCLKSCFSLSEFITRYRLLFFHLSRPVSPSPELCHSVLSKSCRESQYRVGRTKVFLSRRLVAELDEKLEKTSRQVILIQKIFRGVLGRKQYQAKIKKRNQYDHQRSVFFSEITAGISKFHDHLSLQVSEDQRRLKQNKLKEELAKTEASESNVAENKSPATSPDRCMSYAWGDELIIDETSESLTWCNIVCFQRTKQLAMFSVKDPKVVIDGTNHSFTADRIGFNSFPTPSHDKQMKTVKACIGRGVELLLAEDGSLIAVRLCKNPIFVKGHFCEAKLLRTLGELSKNEESKLFDYRRFMEKINYVCHPARLAIDSEDKSLAMCVVHLCFVKNSDSDDGAPCWVELVLTRAVQYVKHAISFSMQRRREVQEKYHFQQPPALRMDSKMESTSAKILKLIRPSRYIETVRFKRKAWARKRVVSNPFQYGEDSFNEDDRSESASVSSPDNSYAEETVSNEEISPEGGGQELYENANVINAQDERHRSRSACLPDNSYAGHSVFESTLPERGEDFYENVEVKNVQEKWRSIFKTSQVESGDVSDHLDEEDSSRKVNVEIHSLSENGGQVLYENVHIQKDMGHKEGRKVSDVAEIDHERNYVYEHRIEQSERRKVIQVQSNDHEEQQFYENTREHFQSVENKWRNVFEMADEDKQNGDVSGGLQERNVNEVDSQGDFASNQSFLNPTLTSVSPEISPLMVNQKGMSNVNIPEKLDIRRENHIQVIKEDSGSSMNDTEDMYVNTRMIKIRQRPEGCNSRGESMLNQGDQTSSTPRKMSLGRVTEQSEVKEEVYVDSDGQVRLISEVVDLHGESLSNESFQMSSTPGQMSLNHVTGQPEMKEREDEMSYLSGPDCPSPDYLDSGSVYTTMRGHENKDESQENEDVYEVMRRSRVSHHEMVYHSEEQYVNVSSSRQHLQRTSDVGITSSVHEESAQKLMKHRMSFPRL